MDSLLLSVDNRNYALAAVLDGVILEDCAGDGAMSGICASNNFSNTPAMTSQNCDVRIREQVNYIGFAYG